MYNDTYKFKQWLRESHHGFLKTKRYARKVRDYLNGEQLDDDIKLLLANRGQPEQHENNIAKHNNAILGFKSDRRTEIKLLGTQDQDKSTANILSAIIKTIRDTSEYQEDIDVSDEQVTVEGASVVWQDVVGSGEYDSFNREHKNIKYRTKDINNIYFDPYFNGRDYSKEARYIHEAFWTDKENLYKVFDNDTIDKLSSSNFLSDVHEDDLVTDEYARERVLIVYTWYKKYDKETKKDKVYYALWSGSTILVQNESPFIYDGFPCTVAFCHYDFRAKIKYWGLYKDVMPIQDAINYAKLRLQNMMSSNKTYVNRTAVIDEDMETFAAENSLDDANVMVEDVNGIKVVNSNAQIQQLLNVIIDGRNQINEILGVNKEMLGTANNRMSAVAQETRIETGLVGLSKFMKVCENRDKRIAKLSVKMIEQYYDTERVISIVDEEYGEAYLTVNETFKNQYGGYELEYDEQTNTHKPMSMNTISHGTYDMVYISKPKDKSLSAERLRQNTEVLKVLQSTNPELVKYLLPDIMKDNGSPSADKIRNIILEQDEKQANNPQQQMMNQIEQAKIQQEMAYKNSMINLNNAKAKAMMDKNKVDLQKAYSNALIASDKVTNKQQYNMYNANKRIG